MPKIVIKEVDNTKAGLGEYSNFAVLVPGFVNEATYDDSEYDDNNVVELKTRADFIKYVGKRAPEAGLVSKSVDAERNEGDALIFEDDPAGTAGGKTAKEKLIAYLDGTGTPHLPANTYLYAWRPNTEGLHGLLKYFNDETGEGELYSQVTLEMAREESYQVEPTGYYLIEIGKEGKDAVTGTQYGNQIAYELINLGYTVLFKKLDLIGDLEDDAFWAPLKDKSIYDFRYVINGLLTGNAVANKKIRALADSVNKNLEDGTDTGRGDCTALCDIDAEAYTGLSQAEAIKGIEKAAAQFEASKYAALFAPYVIYSLPYDGVYQNEWFPASFHYLACAAKAAENYNEWYAVAGYTRGICNYSLKGIGCKLGEEAVQALEPRYNTWDAAKQTGVEKAINIIVKIKNNYYLWGNRTAEKLGTYGDDDGDLRASHFLNIRQLCTTIKKQVYITCRRYTFDPNSDVLWINFCNAIRPLLEKMKADQGITDYKFIKVKTQQKGLLKAKIRIVPIEAVEDFDITLFLEDSITGTDIDIDDTEKGE